MAAVCAVTSGQRPTWSIGKCIRIPKHYSLLKFMSLRAGGSVTLGTSDVAEGAVLSGGGVRGNPGPGEPTGASQRAAGY